jgi:hypothetical protein
MKNLIGVLVVLYILSALAGCGPKVVKAHNLVELVTTEAVLRGQMPCHLRVVVDGEEVFRVLPTAGVHCGLPEELLMPEDSR